MYINKVNNKKYIGITRRTLEERAGSNGCHYKGCTAFYRAIQKYGFDSFERVLLFDELTEKDAKEKEIEMIIKYKTRNAEFGYNISKGGDMPKDMDKENNPFYGKHHSEKVKQMIRYLNHNRVWTEEQRNHMREIKSGDKSPAAKKVVRIEDGKVYSCIKYAAQDVNVTQSKITDVLKGRHKTCKGYHYAYYDVA